MDEYPTKTAAEVFGAHALTRLSTCSTKPSETLRKKPGAKTRDLIGRLGLRYRPTNQADLEAHAGMLALLAEDLADLPTGLLEVAIIRHCTTSPFMPKAADLIKLAQDAQDGDKPSGAMQIGEMRQIQIRDKPGGIVVKTLTLERTARPYARDLCDAYNDGRHPPRWRVTDNGELAMVE